MTKHNHITRDIKPLGECPSCDEHHYRNRIKTATPQELLQNESVREVVEALKFIACKLDYRPTNKPACELAAIKALKKFEVMG